MALCTTLRIKFLRCELPLPNSGMSYFNDDKPCPLDPVLMIFCQSDQKCTCLYNLCEMSRSYMNVNTFQ